MEHERKYMKIRESVQDIQYPANRSLKSERK